MGAIDKITEFFRFNEEDDFDEIEDEGYDALEEEYEEDDDVKDDRKKIFGSKKESADTISVPERSKSSSRSNIVPIKTQITKELEVVVIRPQSMEDAKEITDTLLYGKAVVLNLEGIHVEIAQRIIDYSAGSTYAIRGNLQKITNFIFLVTPPNVDISGDIPELVGGGIDLAGVKTKSDINQL